MLVDRTKRDRLVGEWLLLPVMTLQILELTSESLNAVRVVAAKCLDGQLAGMIGRHSRESGVDPAGHITTPGLG
jgi:hypothetical protein